MRGLFPFQRTPALAQPSVSGKVAHRSRRPVNASRTLARQRKDSRVRLLVADEFGPAQASEQERTAAR
jgi:hypothetical protein